jgi:hypothetical protein
MAGLSMKENRKFGKRKLGKLGKLRNKGKLRKKRKTKNGKTENSNDLTLCFLSFLMLSEI